MYSGNFKDTIFILNMRIRMMRDTLRLNPSPEIFLERSLDDLTFIDRVLETFTESLLNNDNQYGVNGQHEQVSNTEWQFNQALIDFSLDTNPFPINDYPEAQKQIIALRGRSNARRKTLEENNAVQEVVQAERIVSIAEMNGLLGGI